VCTTHLAHRFKQIVGITPKRLARTYRFAKVAFSVDAAAAVDWGELAFRAGYFDQSHVVKDRHPPQNWHITTRGDSVSKVIMGCAAVSIDGFIANENDEVGALFDWVGNGDVEWTWSGEPEEYPMHSTRASIEFVRAVYPRIGCVVIGRRVFDLTDGWDGVPAAGEHVFVVTHEPPTDWKYAETGLFTFVTDGVEAAIERARAFAGDDRIVDLAAGQIGGQALRLGLVDQVVLNVVPVVFGSGRPFFGAMGAGDVVPLDNPARVVQGDRVTHMLYDVSRPSA
jgi:dihydrofolate reductase